MNKLKKSLSVFLTLVMLFTTLCFFVIPETDITANAAENDVIICVPETIYMTPNGGASNSGQYYVNNVVDKNGNVTLDAERAYEKGKISIYAPGATHFALNVVAASGSYGEPKIGSTNTADAVSYETNWAFSQINENSPEDYMIFDGLHLYLDGSGMSTGNVASIKWEITLTYENGTTATYYAYSTLYSPHRSVGAISEARRNDSRNHEIDSWVAGINGLPGEYSPLGYGSGQVTGNGYFKYDPLWTEHQGNIGSSNSYDDFLTSDGNNLYVEAKATNGDTWTRAISYLGQITVDSSRYTATNQIPNFRIGVDILRYTSQNPNQSMKNFYSYYTLGTATQIGEGETSKPSGWTTLHEEKEPGAVYRKTVVPAYNVSEIDGKYIHVAAQGYADYLSSQQYSNAWSSAIFKTVNKANLRDAVKTALTKQAQYGVKDGFGSELYDTTSTTWKNYVSAYENACLVLGNPSASADAVNSAESALESAMEKLDANSSRKIYFDVNYGGINPNLYVMGSSAGTTNGVSATVDATNETVTFNGITTGNSNLIYTPFTPDAGNYTFSATKVSGSFSGGGCLVFEAYTDAQNQLNSISGYERKKLDISSTASNVVNFDANHATATDLMGVWIWHNTDAAAGTYSNLAYKFKIEEGGTKTEYSPAARITDSDGTYPVLPVPSRVGYDFGGWYTDAACTTKVTADTNFAGSMLYAKWTLKTFTVTFDNLINFSEWNTASAGNGVISNVGDGGFTLTSNEGVGEATSSSPFFPVTPGKKYKIDIEFEGDAWDVYIFFCDANGNWIDFADGPTNRYSANGSTGVSKDNAVFTAPNKDSVVKAQIRVDANGSSNAVTFKNIRVYEEGTAVSGAPYTPSQTVTYTGTYGELPTPVRDGYTFTGWYDANGTKIESTTQFNLTSNQVLYSKWDALPYTITWIDGHGGTVKTETLLCGSAITIPTASPTFTGYIFKGWEDHPATMPAHDLTITALWDYATYKITYDLKGGAVNGTAKESYTVADSFALPFDLTKTGYIFDGWTVTGENHNWIASYNDKNEVLSNLYGDVTLTANWTPLNYIITYDLNGGNMAEASERIYDIEDTFNLPSNPAKTGHVFTGWEVVLTTGNWEGTFAPGANVSGKYGDVTLKATWAPEKYNVTWVNYDDTRLEFDENVPYGTTPEYNSAVPTKPEDERYTYVFTGWYPEVSAVTGHAVYRAQFEPIVKTFTVTFTYTTNEGQQTVTLTGVEYGTEVVKIIPAEFTKGYYNSADCDGFNHRHYLPQDTIDVETITKNESFIAEYVQTNVTELFERADDYLAPTCTNPGLDSRFCSSCGYAYSEEKPETGHGHDSGVVTKEATCFAPGEITYTCHCGDIYTEEISQLKHSFIHYDAKESTCAEQGNYEYYYCKNCELCYKSDDLTLGKDDAIDPYIPTTDHTPDELNPATCETPQLCKVCGQQVKPALGHDYYVEYEYDVNSGISCVVPGNYTVVTKCRNNCGPGTRVDKYGTLEHNYEYAETVKPTCEEDGYDIYKCSTCQGTEHRNPVDATGHKDGEWVTVNESTCTVQGDKELHCSVCGEVIDTAKIDYLPHDCEWVTQDPDCITAGKKEYICKVCGYVDMSERLPSLGHKSSGLASCETDSICTVCGTVLQKALGHTWDNGKVIKEPTETETGIMEYTCYRDSEHKKTEDIPVRVVIELPPIPEDGTYDLDADASGYAGNIGDIVKVEDGIPYTAIVNNAGIVTINPNGDIFVAGDGNAVITVITNDGKYHKSFTVTVRTVKTIIFDVNGVLSYKTAYTGDKFEAVEVNDFRDAETGFLKVFTGWTVNGVVLAELICTGDMYLVAQFTAPCDYDEFDELSVKFYDVIGGAYDNAGLIEANAATVEKAKALIEEFNADRDVRDSGNQHLVDAAEKQLAAAIVKVYPEKNASLSVRGKTECTAGTYVEITAYLMPIEVELSDCIWSTSDRTVGFFSEGRFFAVRPGTVTLNVARGTHTAAITINVKGTTGARVVFFDTLLTNARYILEGAYIVEETTNLFWAPDTDIHFRVVTDHTYEEYAIYVNDVRVTPAADGTFTIPANTGDAHIKMIGLMDDITQEEPDESPKVSFWDMIRNFFKKIGDFFRSLFGM